MAINPGVAEIQEKRRMLLVGLDANEGFEQGLHDRRQLQIMDPKEYGGKNVAVYALNPEFEKGATNG